MKRFLEKYENNIQGVISGFDRLIFRGGIRSLMYEAGMASYLNYKRILLKDFKTHAPVISQQLVNKAKIYTEKEARPFTYLQGYTKGKEAIAREIAMEDGIKEGLVCVFSTLENCNSYKVVGNRSTQKLELKRNKTKCRHLYYYWVDPLFGLMHGRIQTWYPFNIQFYINGKEWLANLMIAKKIAFHQVDNCFTWIKDFNAASKIAEKQFVKKWPRTLNAFSKIINPLSSELFSPGSGYYWTTHQSEVATDILFKNTASLDRIYHELVYHSMLTFDSKDVIHFLGKRININGEIPINFNSEVISDFKNRTEGIRVKHSLGPNSVKFYNKAGSVLRVETTINQPNMFKVLRTVGNTDELKYQPMRKSVVDLSKRAKISLKINERHLNSLSLASSDKKFLTLINSLLLPVTKNNKRTRGMNPLGKDAEILRSIANGSYQINGFRNRDIRYLLFPNLKEKNEIKRCSAKISRHFKILRDHGIIKKVPRTHRYLLTNKGTQLISALSALQNIKVSDIVKAAA